MCVCVLLDTLSLCRCYGIRTIHQEAHAHVQGIALVTMTTPQQSDQNFLSRGQADSKRFQARQPMHFRHLHSLRVFCFSFFLCLLSQGQGKCKQRLEALCFVSTIKYCNLSINQETSSTFQIEEGEGILSVTNVL